MNTINESWRAHAADEGDSHGVGVALMDGASLPLWHSQPMKGAVAVKEREKIESWRVAASICNCPAASFLNPRILIASQANASVSDFDVSMHWHLGFKGQWPTVTPNASLIMSSLVKGILYQKSLIYWHGHH